MQAAVQLFTGDHVAKFAVFVCFSRLKWFGIGHGNWRLKARFKAGQIAKIGRGWDGNLPA